MADDESESKPSGNGGCDASSDSPGDRAGWKKSWVVRSFRRGRKVIASRAADRIRRMGARDRRESVIALLGPKGMGKATFLASLSQANRNGVNGFTADRQPSVAVRAIGGREPLDAHDARAQQLIEGKVFDNPLGAVAL